MKFNRHTLIGMVTIGALLMTAKAEIANAGLDCVSVANECTGSLTVAQRATELGTVGSPMSLLFPLFDSTVGTLTGASVVVSGTMYTLSGSSVTNVSLLPQTFSAAEDEKFHLADITRPSSSLAAALASSFFSTVYLDPTASQNYTGLAASTAASFGPYTTVGSATLANSGGSAGLPALSLVDMQASGGGIDTLDLYTGTTTSNTGAGGNVQETFLTNGSLDISIVYAFSAPIVETPEPASLALVGTGLAGLGLIRRRQKV